MDKRREYAMREAAAGCIAAVMLFGCDGAAAGDLAPYTQGFPSNFNPAPIYNWSGFYVGAIGGGSAGISRHLFTDLTVDTGDFRVDGGLFGASFGLNYQTGRWVWGLDGDIAWTAIGGSQNIAGAPFSANLDWLNTFRVRVGYAFDRFLPYLTVGPAFGGLSTRVTMPATGVVSGHETRSGWGVGTGLEYGISDNVTAKLEYLYVCFGETTELAIDRVTFMSHYVRGAVNYKFDWGDRDYTARPAAKPIGVPSGYDWTGFYVGAMFGGSWSKLAADYTFGSTGVSGGSHFGDGGLRFGLHGLIGLQAGYNWQAGHLVTGLESDFQLTQLSGDTASTRVDVRSGAATGTLLNTMNQPLSGTLRARAGYAYDRWLFYGTAGLAYGEFDKDSTFTTSLGGSATSSLDTTRIGWVAGLGVEGALWANWTAKLEYLYMDLGSVSDSFAGIAPFNPITSSIHIRSDFLRAAISAKFN
jgi:outer membrane immunogenic protein